MRAPARLLVVAVVLAVAGTAAALVLTGRGSSSATPPAAACPRDSSGVKLALAGIVSIGTLPPGDLPYVGGLSVNVAWADLQRAPGAALVHPNAIDGAIAQLRAGGAGCALGIKLRVLAGVQSPQWVKDLAGGPVQLSSSASQTLTGSIPRFWSDQVGAAYDDLQRRLAAAYDDVPEVREVAMSRCTTFYAEPLLRQIDAAGANGAAYAAAGLDQAHDAACLQQQTQAAQVWKHTRSTLALNPYVTPGAATTRPSLGLPLQVARDCRAALGARCILANNSIRWPVLAGLYPALYDAMVGLGGPLEFQTAAPDRIGDVGQTVGWAADRHAGSVEMEPAAIEGAAAALASLGAARLPGAEALQGGH